MDAAVSEFARQRSVLPGHVPGRHGVHVTGQQKVARALPPPGDSPVDVVAGWCNLVHLGVDAEGTQLPGYNGRCGCFVSRWVPALAADQLLRELDQGVSVYGEGW